MHRGKAADEEPGVGANDMMIGLEPGDITRVDFAEADKSAHFVDVAADGFGEIINPADKRIGMIADQRALRLKPPQQRV